MYLKLGIRARINTAFLAVALLTLAVAGSVFYVTAKQVLTKQVFDQLQSIAAMQSARIKDVVDHNLERLDLISSQTQLPITLAKFSQDFKREHRDVMNRMLADAISSISNFKTLTVSLLDGTVAASTDEALIGSPFPHSDLVLKGQDVGSADNFHLGDNGQIAIFLVGPIKLDGHSIGLIIIESDGEDILASLRDYSGLGDTGETMLAKTDRNGDALFLAPLRFDETAALTAIAAKPNIDAPMIQTLQKKNAFFGQALDYRGENVFFASEYIFGPGWAVVVKKDAAESLSAMLRFRQLMMLMVLITVVIVVVISVVIARGVTQPIVALSNVAKTIQLGDFSHRANVASRGEFGLLASAFNEMMDEIARTNSMLIQNIEELVAEIDQRKSVENELHKHRNRLRSLATEIDQAEERERRRIAIDMHDSIIQDLGLLKIQLGQLIHDSSSAETSLQAKDARELVAKLINETRSLIFDLSLPVLYDLGFTAAINWVAENVSTQYGIPCTVNDDGIPRFMNEETQVSVFKAVRELLNNVRKHAQASTITIFLETVDQKFSISVQDDGKGFDPEFENIGSGDKMKFGLFGIKERIDLLEGQVQIQTSIGQGTKITLSVPASTAIHHDLSRTNGIHNQE